MDKGTGYTQEMNILHQRAEKKLKKNQTVISPELMEENAQYLIHELQVNQIELELQNEELKAANTKANHLLNKYTDLYNFAPSGYFTLDRNGKILEANLSGAMLLGIQGGPANIRFQTFVLVEYIAAFNSFLSSIIKTGEKQMCEIQLANNDASPIFVKIEGTISRGNEGGGKQILISVMDITEHKQIKEYKENAEKSLQLLNETLENDKIKTEFFANISHELRTPLNVILSTLQLVEMLKKKNYPTESKLNLDKHIGVIKQNCFRLLRLINNLIDVTRIDSGFYSVNLRNYDIIAIIKDVTMSVAQFIESKGITLQLSSNVESKIIACDPDKIERVVLNILSNAVKFTKQGGVIAVNIADAEDHILVSFKDTGIGIPEDKLEEIFYRFRQIDKSLTREYEGSGIGLNLVKSIVQMLGGCITVKSKFGMGSEFILKLPAMALTDDECAARSMFADEKQSRIERINIEFSDIY